MTALVDLVELLNATDIVAGLLDHTGATPLDAGERALLVASSFLPEPSSAAMPTSPPSDVNAMRLRGRSRKCRSPPSGRGRGSGGRCGWRDRSRLRRPGGSIGAREMVLSPRSVQ